MGRFLYEVGVIVIILIGLAIFKWFDGGMVAAGEGLKDPTVQPQAQTFIEVPMTTFSEKTIAVTTETPAASGTTTLSITATNTKAEESVGLVDVNTANQEELMTLNGIGEVIATRIIDYRQQHGLFTCAQDLLEVKGIGEKKLEKIRESLVFP